MRRFWILEFKHEKLGWLPYAVFLSRGDAMKALNHERRILRAFKLRVVPATQDGEAKG